MNCAFREKEQKRHSLGDGNQVPWADADSADNALRTEQKFEARVLAIGGGGAGGYGTTCTIYLGGGGGGVQAGGRSGTNPGGGDEMEQLDRRRAYYYTPG